MSEDTTVESALGSLAEEMIDPVTGEIIDQKKLAEQLLAQAKEQNIDLVGLDEYCDLFDGKPAEDESSRHRRIEQVRVTESTGTAFMTLRHGENLFSDAFVLLRVDANGASPTRRITARLEPSPCRQCLAGRMKAPLPAGPGSARQYSQPIPCCVDWRCG